RLDLVVLVDRPAQDAVRWRFGFFGEVEYVRVVRGHANPFISRRCRAMARLRRNDIIHKRHRANLDLACSRKERLTLVWPSSRSKSQISSNVVASLDRGGENSLNSSRTRRSGCHSTISSTWLDPSQLVTRIRVPITPGVSTSNAAVLMP